MDVLYYIIFLLCLISLIALLVTTFPEFKISIENIILIIIAIIIIYVVLKFLALIISLWYFIFGIFLLGIGIAIAFNKEIKIIKRILIFSLIVFILFFLYQYKSILIVVFDVKFNNHPVFEDYEYF